ncbi:hypothetical protein BD289DRAFT_290314 [Coniella lustricola]|uniref:Uncharacterized protein n=1 Tax=Coniella lustricola TaxID=2025994 RepID=A0A2T3A5I1_9PEZI|nr:hypothetical protein BD289DRAFT_290314 [Coniella lustricola]
MQARMLASLSHATVASSRQSLTKYPRQAQWRAPKRGPRRRLDRRTHGSLQGIFLAAAPSHSRCALLYSSWLWLWRWRWCPRRPGPSLAQAARIVARWCLLWDSQSTLDSVLERGERGGSGDPWDVWVLARRPGSGRPRGLVADGPRSHMC